jgi:hypothetical protein
MFLILISCNNSILLGRFYFTDKRLFVSLQLVDPALRNHHDQFPREEQKFLIAEGLQPSELAGGKPAPRWKYLGLR